MYEYSIAKKCPICGNTLGYYVDSCGQLVKKCTACKHIIADNTVVTNKTNIIDYNKCPINTNNAFNASSEDRLFIDKEKLVNTCDINPIYKYISAPPVTLEMNCDSITLVNNGIFITFNDKGNEIKQFDSITINGVKFKKVDEDNE